MLLPAVCKDDDPKCADLALARQCIEGDIRYWMLTNCSQSCGLCQGRTCSTSDTGLVAAQYHQLYPETLFIYIYFLQEKKRLLRWLHELMDTC